MERTVGAPADPVSEHGKNEEGSRAALSSVFSLLPLSPVPLALSDAWRCGQSGRAALGGAAALRHGRSCFPCCRTCGARACVMPWSTRAGRPRAAAARAARAGRPHAAFSAALVPPELALPSPPRSRDAMAEAGGPPSPPPSCRRSSRRHSRSGPPSPLPSCHRSSRRPRPSTSRRPLHRTRAARAMDFYGGE